MLKTPFMFTTLAASMLLAGCTSLAPDYQRPQLDTPSAIALPATKLATAEVDYAAWWKSFQDPVLDALLEEARHGNQDLLLATARIDEARALAVGAKSNRYPTVDATLSASKLRTSQNAGKIAAGADPYGRDYQVGLTASYELDLWGKLSRADEAARARLLSQVANRGVVLTSLYSTLAQNYFTLRASDAELVLAEGTLQARVETLRLQRKLFAAGSIGELELHVADSEAAAAEISLAQARQSVANTEAAIALLLGRSPAAIAQPVIARGSDIANLYQQLRMPAELPSDVLNRRPDLIAAEQSLVAANADVGQAKALYFPTLKLTSSVGYESQGVHNLIDPASMLWNLGANLVQPVFRAGAIGALVEGADARKNQALAQYVQAVQSAFRDVHDALTASTASEQIYHSGQRRVSALQDSLRLAQLRHKNGYSSYLEVLNAQRDLWQAQVALIDTQRAHLSAVVSLNKALGGGWDMQALLAEK